MKDRVTALVLALLCLGGCAGAVPGESAAPPAAPSSAVPAETQAPPPDASQNGEPSPEATPAPTPTPVPTPEPTPAPVLYHYGQPVEEGEERDSEEWFADAVFLGDSRTEGMQVYSGIRSADFIWHRGLSVFNAVSDDYRFYEADGEQLTLLEALALKQYGKIYIMIGINELGYAASTYEKSLGELLDRVREEQPDAVIYLQTIPPVNEGMASAKGLKSYINNENVNAFNEAVVRQAREKQVALLDVASVFRTEAGDLAEDMAADGVHFRKEGYKLWTGYLLTHTLDPESYRAGAPAEEVWSPLPAPTPEPTPAPAETASEPPAEPAPAPTGTSPEPSAEPTPVPTESVPEPPAPTPTLEPAPNREPVPTEEPGSVPAPSAAGSEPPTETSPEPGPDPAPDGTEPEPSGE